jgi:hypothetical protein
MLIPLKQAAYGIAGSVGFAVISLLPGLPAIGESPAAGPPALSSLSEIRYRALEWVRRKPAHPFSHSSTTDVTLTRA